MAKFKISLLTPTSLNKSSSFLKAILGDYTTPYQTSNKNVCYTYNEKFSIHQNAQKELTFSMDRNILNNDERYINPFVAAIHVGSLIQLEDKYNNTYLFIVKNIAYTFNEYNIVYNYTCQDAFSYQHTRQQSGYTIQNDASSDNFIGPKTIDWWVQEKIIPECYIEYSYVPINKGLYITTKNTLHLFNEEDRAIIGKNNDIKAILKEPFSNIVVDDNNIAHDEYQTTITFSCNNSNANAALISLGDNLNLMLHTYEGEIYNANEQEKMEHTGPIQYYKYFWFEPKQNQDVTGLTYSPKNNISNFSLNFAGDSLTTVLNVNSHDLGDELITLLPSTPSFFLNLFMDDSQWNNDNIYYPGYFSDLINGKKFGYINNPNDNIHYNDIMIDTCEILNSQWLVNKIYTTSDKKFILPLTYNKFESNWNNNLFTHGTIIDTEHNKYRYSSKGVVIYLIIKDENKFYPIASGEEIPNQFLGQAVECYIGLSFKKTVVSIEDLEIYIHFYRNFTKEEKEFAEIADSCPWLENRLIDFSYFLKQNIITRQEYQTILSKLQNDLRIVNGKLLYYTDTYYTALKEKVKKLNEITNSLDAFGAAFEADVVSPAMHGDEPHDVADLSATYSELFTFTSDQKQPILNYNEILNDYFDKYLSTEQRFLKNIYAFKDYFNSICLFSSNANAGIYEDIIQTTLPLTTENQHFISLNNVIFTQWNGEDQCPVFKYINNKFYDANLITEDNYWNYYKPLITTNTLIKLNDINPVADFNYDFNANNHYYLTQSEYNNFFKSLARIDVNTFKDNDGTIYCELTVDEIKRLVLYHQLKNNNKNFYIKDNTKYTPLDWIRLDREHIEQTLTYITLPNLASFIDDSDSECQDITNWSLSNNSKFMWKYYKSFFPLNEIYFKGGDYKYSITTDETNSSETYSFYRVNSAGLNIKDLLTKYIKDTYPKEGKITDIEKYITQNRSALLAAAKDSGYINSSNDPYQYEKYFAIDFISNGYLLNDWGPCSNEYASVQKESIDAAWPYYAFKYQWRKASEYQQVTSGNIGENLCQWLKTPIAYRSFEGHYGNQNIRHVRNDSGSTFGWGGGYKNYTVFWEMPDGDNDNKTWNESFNTHGFKWDSYFANYCKTPTAGNDYQKLVSLWAKHPKINYNSLPSWIKNYQIDCIDGKIQVEFEPEMQTESNVSYYQYFNFYKYIAASYSFRRLEKGNSLYSNLPNNNLYVKNKYLRILSQTSKVNKDDVYVRIPVYENFASNIDTSTNVEKTMLQNRKEFLYIKHEGDNLNTTWFPNRFSTITWYPLYDLAYDLKLSSTINWGNTKVKTLKEIVNALYANENVDISFNGSIVSISDKQGKYLSKYIYCHLEEYEKRQLSITSNEYINPDNYYFNIITNKQKLSSIYKTDDDTEYRILSEHNILYGLDECSIYMLSNSDDAFVKLTKDDIKTSENYFYNKTANNKYERAYTAQQIKKAYNDESYQYCTQEALRTFRGISGTSTTITNFIPTILKNDLTIDETTKPKFNLTLYLSSIEKNANGEYEIHSKIYKGSDNKLQFEYNNNSMICTKSIDYEGVVYTSTFSLNEVKKESLQGLTNGTFWYRYHDKIEWPKIFEIAATIETKLQSYWDQAYTASKYCKYFLPKSWQPDTQAVKNAFAENILTPIYSKRQGQETAVVENVMLSNHFLPEVKMYINDTVSKTNYRNYLPKYTWYWDPNNKPDISEIAKQGLDYKNYTRATDIELLDILFNEQTGLNDVMQTLNTKLSDWYVIENGLTVYYYNSNNSTGMLWSNLANELNSSCHYDKHTGLYGMAWYILYNYYTKREIEEYINAKEEHNRIWHEIYSDYPFLILEDNYSYPQATNSSELLKMAKLIFKGKREPERNYTLSLIDSHSLQGYIGQELKPGQGIMLKASDYYNENDDIATALKQYLFITDVSYSLRDDSNISVTVNSIKYQEKLLQSLVKLIR